MALSKLNLSDSNNHVPISKVDIGFVLKQQLKELRSGKISDRQEYQFKSEAVKFLVAFCTHIKEKSPLSSFFARQVLINYFIDILLYWFLVVISIG